MRRLLGLRVAITALAFPLACAPNPLDFVGTQADAAGGSGGSNVDASATDGAAGAAGLGGAAGSAGTGGTAGARPCGAAGPAQGEWCLISNAKAPSARAGYAVSVWSDSAFLVWGGRNGPGSLFADGGKYLPETDTWTPVGAPVGFKARAGHAVFWAQDRLVVCGGGNLGQDYYRDGARYDPATDEWQGMAAPPASFAGRDLMSVASNGSVGLIWGGCGGPLGDGALYNPKLDSWSLLPSQGAPSARCDAPAAWLGPAAFLLYGGTGIYASGVIHANGGSYSTGSWSGVSTPLLGPRRGHTLVVVDGTPVLWGGASDFNSTRFVNTGASYGSDWVALPVTSATPSPRTAHAAVATSDAMIIWGGAEATNCFNDGSSYDLATRAWTPLPPAPLAPRGGAAAAWTGSELIIWGGCCGDVCFNDGARFRP